MPEFRLTRKAIADLKSIARYTETQWGRAQRNTYLSRLDQAFQALAEHPAQGTDCAEVRAGYRRYRTGRHMIYYRALSGTGGIEIVRVLHDRMDPDRHL